MLSPWKLAGFSSLKVLQESKVQYAYSVSDVLVENGQRGGGVAGNLVSHAATRVSYHP